MSAHRGDLIHLTAVQARELPIGTLLEEVDGAAVWWKKGRSTWACLDDPRQLVRLSPAMVGRTFWVLRGDPPAA
ncbi:hypothetical protein [Corynebacterium glyciniphilum]|uniref:hypothetical protein n=1 Tax=Corynebacterium glyciniphilum TaxID=1404244 RepID=UPI003FD56002